MGFIYKEIIDFLEDAFPTLIIAVPIIVIVLILIQYFFLLLLF